MKNAMEVVPKPVVKAVARDSASQGARRASEEGLSRAAPANPEVVAVARRRQFSPSEKRRILAAADRCTSPGSKGALLRREGIYSSHLRTWRRQREVQETQGLEGGKRGPKANPAIAEAQRTAKLAREVERLRRELAQAQLIIEVQKKVSALLGLHTTTNSKEEPA